ncbi:MAG: hypothetical protein ABSB73_06275 [Solirubrobacteraceae bacterium]
MRVRLLAGVAVVVLTSALAAAGCGGTSKVVKSGCMRLDKRAFSPYAESGDRVIVKAGTIVYAVEALPAMGWPSSAAGFPWMPPVSSNSRVLAHVRLCSTTVMTMEGEEQVFAFRALHAGTATLSASLTGPWKRANRPPSPYRATIAVR